MDFDYYKIINVKMKYDKMLVEIKKKNKKKNKKKMTSISCNAMLICTVKNNYKIILKSTT